ncbi:MAG: hypothetical protein FWB83_11320 [Treponema sp.]|nr:hypothetical protein [Treponema sp.]
MKFNNYNDVKTFYADVYDTLLRDETQNLIPLGNLIVGNEGRDKNDWRDPVNWFMASVSDNAGILLTAIMTPPYNITLYATDNIINDEAIICLINGIQKNNIHIPGVMTEKTLCECFAKYYSKATGRKFNIHTEMRIHELEKVNLQIPNIGVLRLARESDMSFLPYWIESFNSDCFGRTIALNPDPDYYLYHIRKQKLYILEDNNTPVSMTQKLREMKTVCGVSYVYTPPYFRGKGYASSCAAGVSRLIIEQGYAKCALYTDLANPVSNSIYRKIGYMPVCDVVEIKFDEA